MQLSSSKILSYFNHIVQRTKPYLGFIVVVTLLCIYIFQVARIGQLTSDSSTQANSSNNANTTSQLSLDQKSIKQIMDLESQNIEVKTIFEDARNNPFSD